MGKKSNWDRIRGQKIKDNVKYRDVYADQQLERSEIQQKETMTSRNIINGVACVFAAILVWCAVTFFDALGAKFSGPEQTTDPSAIWIHMNAHYVNVNDESDKITPEEYQLLLDAYDPSYPEMDPPEKPVNPDDCVRKTVDGVTGYVDLEGNFYSKEEYDAMKAAYPDEMTIYKAQLEEYTEYSKLHANPAKTYSSQKEHYRNGFNLSEYILPATYQERVSEYEAKKAKGKIDEDVADVPAQPFDPKPLWKVAEYDEFTDENGKKIPLTYRNIYDGSLMDKVDYDNAVSDYQLALKNYQAAYQTHREIFHPDNISGSAMEMSWGFTFKKFLITLGLTGILYAILYQVLKRNLDAQNALNETSDINQYHNDQHVALPEEVQRDFDWFPDIGATSGVQVSSMISHMALMNKGLKNVNLAKRAEKDIVDADGNIEYYKGEILRDDNGDPIVSSVPMIDEKFMDALYEASGAPKEVRKSYDATKIEYNPDGKNRDKLGKYDTVADLINADWEFPLYEPQRPGGAYIVDTAPVNTISKKRKYSV